jgi:hypothetical protein
MSTECIECRWCRDADGPFVVVTDRQACGFRVMELCEACWKKSQPVPADAKERGAES